VNHSGLKRTYLGGLSLLALGVFTVACGLSGNSSKVKVRDLTPDFDGGSLRLSYSQRL
jgi:hypothetical protein